MKKQPTLVTVIGRGHSGTRAISHTLYASGVYMGATLNNSGDLVPAEDLYDACRIMARYVKWKGGLEWDFSRVLAGDIPPVFTQKVQRYLASVLAIPSGYAGWKLPETTMIYPWILRMFPEMRFIFWIRNPRDCIVGGHLTDDLRDFGIAYPETSDERLRRAISWKYQMDLIKATAPAKHWIEVKLEDFVLHQEVTLKRLEAFLGIPLARIVVKPEVVDRWKKDRETTYFDFLAPAMREYGYAVPGEGEAC